jgi:hypothetical protein
MQCFRAVAGVHPFVMEQSIFTTPDSQVVTVIENKDDTIDMFRLAETRRNRQRSIRATGAIFLLILFGH